MHHNNINQPADLTLPTNPSLPSDRRTLLAGIGGLAAGALLLSARSAQAGPLNPPAGPVASTGKTLTEVEPRIAVNSTNTPGDADSLFKITQPGSYYLTGNITGVVGKHGIEIAANGVTLDLSGFDLVGVPAMGAFDGVSSTAAGLTNITVVNGSVRNWGRDGIGLGEFSVSQSWVEGVHASGNARIGIYVGTSSHVSKCSGSGGQYGILARGGSSVAQCSGAGATISGIYVESGSVVTHSTARNCTGTGITALDGSSAIDCSAYGNIRVGIQVDRGGMVAHCTSRENILAGISCESECVIRDNSCSGVVSTISNIRVRGNSNRIEGNHCIRAVRGIDVEGISNLIVRNTCSGNLLNWNVAAGNVCLVVVGVGTGAIVGDSGGLAPGSTDPNANFTY